MLMLFIIFWGYETGFEASAIFTNTQTDAIILILTWLLMSKLLSNNILMLQTKFPTLLMQSLNLSTFVDCTSTFQFILIFIFTFTWLHFWLQLTQFSATKNNEIKTKITIWMNMVDVFQFFPTEWEFALFLESKRTINEKRKVKHMQIQWFHHKTLNCCQRWQCCSRDK